MGVPHSCHYCRIDKDKINATYLLEFAVIDFTIFENDSHKTEKISFTKNNHSLLNYYDLNLKCKSIEPILKNVIHEYNEKFDLDFLNIYLGNAYSFNSRIYLCDHCFHERFNIQFSKKYTELFTVAIPNKATVNIEFGIFHSSGGFYHK